MTLTTAAEPSLGIGDARGPDPILSRPFSVIPVILLVIAVLCGVKFWPSGNKGDPPASAAAAAIGGGKDKTAKKDTPQQDVRPPSKEVPLRPPPNNACAIPKKWCGKQLGFASIIVDVGRREAEMPRRAWIIAVATAMQESTLHNYASDKHAVTARFPHDSIKNDHDSVGLFQQRPASGWGTPEELMDPYIASKKFYGSLKKKVAPWEGWQDPKRVRLTDIAQAVQNSAYPNEYQKHEQIATKIVDLVLQYPYDKKFVGTTAQNNWFVMAQCSNPKARACRAVPWELVKPISDNRAAFARAFPKAQLNGHLGDVRHQNAGTPQDHTSFGDSCYGNVCNALGWVYAQDFGNGKATGTGFDLNHFVHWLLDQLRTGKYEEVKYVISTMPSNKGTQYWGIFFAQNGWKAELRDADHTDHVHLSFKPGFERAKSTIIADYLAARGTA
jgi:hypothetical protein